jgi:hypothetical protein
VTYNLYWSTTSGVTTANGTKIGGISGTNYTQTGLTNGTTYYYVVTAVDTGGESPASNQAMATPVAAALAPPVLTVTPGNGQAMASWTTVTGAGSYNLYYSTTSPVAIATATKVGAISGTNDTVSGLTNCTTYYFAVTAVSGGTESALSNQVSTVPVSSTAVALTPGTAASLTLDANATTTLTFNFPANAVSEATTISLTALTQAELPVPFTETVTSFVTGIGLCAIPSVSAFGSPIVVNGTVASSFASGTQLNLSALNNTTYADTATFQVGAAGALTESIPSVALPGLTTPGTFVLYQPTAGMNTSQLNLGIIAVADDGTDPVQNGLQFIQIYAANGTLLPTPTVTFLPFANAPDLDGQGLTPDGSQGILVDGGNDVYFYSGFLTGNPKVSSTVLDITPYGGDGDSVAMLPNGDEAIASGNGDVEVYITGILSGSPVIASTIPIPAAMGSDLDGLVISNDGKVLLGRGEIGITTWAIAPIAPTPGSLGGTVTHSFTNEGLIQSAGGILTYPTGEDGRDEMAISPVDSTRAVILGYDPVTGFANIQMLTGLPATPTTGTEVALPSPCNQGFAYSVAISPDGTLAAVSCGYGLLLYSGVNTGTLTQVGSLYAPAFTIQCQNPPGSFICGGTTTNVVYGGEGGSTSFGAGGQDIAFTLDGKYVVALDASNYALMVVPVSSSGYGTIATWTGGTVYVPYNNQMVIH